jgi:DNA-binding transcriptional regulator PaaX
MAKQTKKPPKRITVTRMLSRLTGATVAEIMKSTGWKEHSCRAFLTRVRKNASLIKEQRVDGKTAYRIEASPADVTAE